MVEVKKNELSKGNSFYAFTAPVLGLVREEEEKRRSRAELADAVFSQRISVSQHRDSQQSGWEMGTFSWGRDSDRRCRGGPGPAHSVPFPFALGLTFLRLRSLTARGLQQQTGNLMTI